MNTMVIAGILTGVRAALAWLTAYKSGNREVALEIINAVDLRPFGLSGKVLELVNYARAGLGYLVRRGVVVEQAMELIELAEAENRDVTSAEVKDYLDLAQVELDETQALIDNM